MDAKTQITRRANAYHWWKGEDFARLCKAVLEHDPATVRVEMREGLDADGHSRVWFRIVDRNSGEARGPEGEQDYDYSWPCPPFCPDGD